MRAHRRALINEHIGAHIRVRMVMVRFMMKRMMLKIDYVEEEN